MQKEKGIVSLFQVDVSLNVWQVPRLVIATVYGLDCSYPDFLLNLMVSWQKAKLTHQAHRKIHLQNTQNCTLHNGLAQTNKQKADFSAATSLIRSGTDLAQELELILACLVLECCETAEDCFSNDDAILHNSIQ